MLSLIMLLMDSQQVYGQAFNFKNFALERNFNKEDIREIYAGTQGYLFLNSKENIFRFDGKNLDDLQNYTDDYLTEISSIRESDKGDLFLLSAGSIVNFDSKSKFYPIPSDLKVNDYLIVGNSIYLGTEQGFKIFDLELNYLFTPDLPEVLKDFPIIDLCRAGERIIISGHSGIWSYYFEQDQIALFPESDHVSLQKMTLDAKGNIWGYDEIGKVYKADILRNKISSYENPGYDFTDLLVDESQKVWLGSSNKGLLLFDQISSKWQIVDKKRGLPDNNILGLEIDIWGKIWILFEDQTLSTFIDQEYILYNENSGWTYDQIIGLESTDRGLFIGTRDEGVFRFAEGNFEKIPIPISLSNSSITCIKSHGRSLWLGTADNGLVQINDDETTIFRKTSDLGTDNVSDIAIDKRGNIWVASPDHGIIRLSQGDSATWVFTHFDEKRGLANKEIMLLFVTDFGTLYFSDNSGGVGVIENESVSYFPKEDIQSPVTAFSEDNNHNVYIAFEKSGIWSVDKNKGRNTSPLPIPNAFLRSRIKDLAIRGDELWLLDDQSVTLIKGMEEDPEIRTFHRSQGFPLRIATSGALAFHEGKVWIAGNNGLLAINQMTETRKAILPNIFFEDIQIDFESLNNIEPAADQSIKYNENRILFKFSGVDIHADEEIKFSYFLEGYDDHWSPWNRDNSQSYHLLPPGKYDFKVRAKSLEGRESEILSFAFNVERPIWQNYWFIFGIGFLLISTLAFIFKGRLNAIQKRNNIEKERLTLRNKLLDLEQKARQLQMNPHFIFNALNSIQATVAKENYESARREINDFAQLMRGILTHSASELITLKEEIELIKKYIEIEKRCRNMDFEVTIFIDESLDPDEVMIPPMLVQPFIENAIVHGLKNKKLDGQLKIKILPLNEKLLLCEIIDNGVGYDFTRNEKSKRDHKSMAVEVTKGRLKHLIDKNDLPGLEITQMDKEKGGTMVRIKIPVQFKY